MTEVIVVPLSMSQTASFSAFIKHLYTVYNDQKHLFRETVIRSLTTALVYEMASAYLSIEKSNLITHSVRSIEITKTFKQQVRRNLKSMKKPSELAANMNITVSHLNDMVRSVTGFPVTYHIQQELMQEAQRLLYYSDLTVKEIADDLGFDDDKYFHRLFNKVIGISPGTFRKSGESFINLKFR